MTLADWLIVVPARLGSERLPSKPLADLHGRPLVVRVAENLAPLTKLGATLIVATDADEVVAACAAHGIRAVRTAPDHPSGTDRCAEVARLVGHAQPLILNVQGDEPFVDLEDLKGLMAAMVDRPEAAMGTLVFRSMDLEVAADPHAVKAVRTSAGWALYFSRAAIPYDRGAAARGHLPAAFWHHLGVYAFRRDQLQAFVRLPPSPLEQTEKLEQLRALDAGWRIWLEPARTFARGIDTPEDLARARQISARRWGA